MNKSKKNKNKEKEPSLNLPLSNKITIKIIDQIDSDLIKSLIFQLYIKTILLKKSLNLKTLYELQLFQMKKKFVIENHSIENLSEGEPFMIDKNTEMEINILLENDSMIDSLKNEENKAKVKFDKINFLKKNCENFIEYKNEKIYFVGMEDEYNKIKSLIDICLFMEDEENANGSIENDHSNRFFYKGLFINGVSGMGKTNLIKNILKDFHDKINFFELDFKNLFLNENEKVEEIIKNTFKYMKIMNPSILIVEDLDKFFTKNEEENSPINFDDKRTRIFEIFKTEVENLYNTEKSYKTNSNNLHQTKNKSLVICTCANLEKIDNEIKKPGNIDFVVNLNPPNQIQRKRLFLHFSKFFKNSLNKEDYEILADKSHGFIPTDIIQVFKNALITMKNNNDHLISKSILEKSLKEIKPINLKDIVLDIPKVLWTDIGGNKASVNKIRQSIEWPLKHPEVFKKVGITSPNGILLYGPPGCSKTMIAKALATESGLNFFAVKGPELFSKYVGDTEKALRDIFKKAKISSPSIIFFDEIDAMATERGSDSAVSDKVLCQLLNEMDGIESRERVVIMGATNRPDILDKALIRPGRFDRLIYIPPPDFEARKEIFSINIKKMNVEGVIDIDNLSENTEQFSGAEINLICREAGMNAITRDLLNPIIEQEDFLHGIKLIKPIITKEMIEYFKGFAEKVKI